MTLQFLTKNLYNVNIDIQAIVEKPYFTYWLDVP